MTACPADPVLSDASGLQSGRLSLGPEPAAFLIPLLQAMSEQTAALNRLASSNESLSQAVSNLIDEMANADGQDPDAEPTTYLDGSRVR